MIYIFGDLGEKLNFQGFREQMQNTSRELGSFLSGIWGDQCIISREQGSIDPPGTRVWLLGRVSFSPNLINWASQNYILICLFDLILYVPANEFSNVPGLTINRLMCLLK